MVSLSRSAFERHRNGGYLQAIVADQELFEWIGKYDKVRGLVEGPLDPGALIG